MGTCLLGLAGWVSPAAAQPAEAPAAPARSATEDPDGFGGEDDGFDGAERPSDDGFGGGGDGFGGSAATGGDGFDGGGDGFGGEGPEPWPAVPPLQVAGLPDLPGDHRLSLSGFVRRDDAVWLERFGSGSENPIAKLRHSLDLSLDYRYRSLIQVRVAGHGEYDLAYSIDTADFDPEQVDKYRRRFLNGEQFMAVSLGDFEITVGRQIVAWGEGDALSPLDVVNPRDLREPGLADLDDLRLAVLASRVGWFVGDHRVEVMGIHEGYYGEVAPPLADYSPFRSVVAGDDTVAALLGDKRLRFKHTPEGLSAGAQMVLGRWVYKGPGLDLGLYAASVVDRTGVVVLPEFNLSLLQAKTVDLVLDHRRYTLVGTSGATTVGPWLLKWEAVAELDKAYNTGDPATQPPDLGVSRGSTVGGMGAVSYTGIQNTTIAFEFQKSWLVDDPGEVLFPVATPIAALRVQHKMLQERLTLAGAATAIGWQAERGHLVRVEASYALADGLSAGLGVVHYGTGDADTFGPFHGFDRHDRFFSKLRYDFAL